MTGKSDEDDNSEKAAFEVDGVVDIGGTMTISDNENEDSHAIIVEGDIDASDATVRGGIKFEDANYSVEDVDIYGSGLSAIKMENSKGDMKNVEISSHLFRYGIDLEYTTANIFTSGFRGYKSDVRVTKGSVVDFYEVGAETLIDQPRGIGPQAVPDQVLDELLDTTEAQLKAEKLASRIKQIINIIYIFYSLDAVLR